MSERMIELQRAKLLAAGKGGGVPGVVPTSQNGSQSGGRSLLPGPLVGNAVNAVLARQSPQQAAATLLREEDAHMQAFIQLLHKRDDSRADTGACPGPTVPTALSRRMLQMQGVGFIDSGVAAVASAAADRFLATILQQAMACRDQRLKGSALRRQAARQRKRHLQQYQTDTDDRWRRKREREIRREQVNLAAIEAAEALKKAASRPAELDEIESGSTSKPKKKKKLEDGPTNGSKLNPKDRGDDSDSSASYDSLDEEEEYYREFYGDAVGDVEDDEEDEDHLILRDFTRPLEAWDFHTTGKECIDRETPKVDLDEFDNVLDVDDEGPILETPDDSRDMGDLSESQANAGEQKSREDDDDSLS